MLGSGSEFLLHSAQPPEDKACVGGVLNVFRFKLHASRISLGISITVTNLDPQED